MTEVFLFLSLIFTAIAIFTMGTPDEARIGFMTLSIMLTLLVARNLLYEIKRILEDIRKSLKKIVVIQEENK